MTIESRNLTPSAPVPVPPATPAVPATSSEALSATAVAPLATSAVPTATAAVPAAPVGMATYPSPFKEFVLNFAQNRGAVIGLLFLLLMVLAAIFAPLIAPHSPIVQYRDHMLQAPAWADGGSWQFILGTDEAGRDVLSRIIHGGRLSLFIGISAVFITIIPGIFLGLLAGFYPRVLGRIIMRVADIMMALPSVLLAIAIMAILGPGITNAMIAIAVVGLPGYIRLVRGSVMSELNKDYVVASRVAGAGIWRLMFIAVLPNCMAPIIVQATLGFSTAILDIAALGFLGLGVQPPAPEWGTMLATARDYISRAWWVVTFPGLAILLTVLAINLMGDGLRDALDPKLKKAA